MGSIILLNGVSSSGKSSIARELRASLGSLCIIMSIDEFMHRELKKKVKELNCVIENGIWDLWWEDLQVVLKHLPLDEQGTYFNDCLQRYYYAIKKHVLAGKLVVVDMVFEDTADFYKILGDLPIILTLVYASLDKILKNLIQRNESSVAHEKRTFASAVRQYSALYKPAHTSDDPIIDTINVAELESYFIYLRKESYWEPEKIERFIRLFVIHFNKVDTQEVCITPMMDYKIIVHTTHDSAYECAQHIMRQL